MSRRASTRLGTTPETASLIRVAFEKRYGRALDDATVDEIRENLRRFNEVISSFELEDRARALLVEGEHRRDQDHE